MISFIWASLIAQFVKIPPAMQEIPVRFLGGDDLLQKDRLLTPVFLSFLCGSAGKESACNAGELGSVRGLERSLGEGKSHQLQYSGLENFMGIHGVAKSRTQLSDFHFPFHTWNLKGKKKDSNELIYKAKIDQKTEKINLYLPKEKEVEEIGIN